MADVTTIAEIGTAAGTLFLGAATFASTRSANRAARVAERSLLLGLRPVLIPARAEDPDPKIIFGDGRKFLVASGTALVEEIDDVVYMAIPLRNAGAGMAVLQRYEIVTENPLRDPHRPLEDGLQARRDRHHGPIENFRRQQRDIYIAPADVGFWQAALRDGEDAVHAEVMRTLADGPAPISVDLLYGTPRAASTPSAASSCFPRGRAGGSAPSPSTGRSRTPTHATCSTATEAQPLTR